MAKIFIELEDLKDGTVSVHSSFKADTNLSERFSMTKASKLASEVMTMADFLNRGQNDN